MKKTLNMENVRDKKGPTTINAKAHKKGDIKDFNIWLMLLSVSNYIVYKFLFIGFVLGVGWGN